MIESQRTRAFRPMTSNSFRYPFNLGDPIGNTHYNSTFTWKPNEVVPSEAIRTATSSGARANNPHPTREFMIFRFRPPSKTYAPHPSSSFASPSFSSPISQSDLLLSHCIRSQMKSTYGTDYVNNVESKAKYQLEDQLKQRRSSSSAAASRDPHPNYSFEYNHPFTYESLHISPTRFGCRSKSIRTAQGILPNLGRT